MFQRGSWQGEAWSEEEGINEGARESISSIPEGLYESHINTIYQWARRMARKFGMLSHVDDLHQEGVIALIHAWKKYDPIRHKVKFNTYLIWWLRGYMGKYIMANMSIVNRCKSDEMRKTFWKEGIKCDFSLDSTPRLNDNPNPSLTGLVGTVCYKNTTMGEMGGKESPITPEAQLIQKDLRGRVRLVASSLTKSPLQGCILSERILNEAPLTFREIGEKMGCTTTNVGNTEKVLMERLNKRIRVELKELNGVL